MLKDPKWLRMLKWWYAKKGDALTIPLLIAAERVENSTDLFATGTHLELSSFLTFVRDSSPGGVFPTVTNCRDIGDEPVLSTLSSSELIYWKSGLNNLCAERRPEGLLIEKALFGDECNNIESVSAFLWEKLGEWLVECKFDHVGGGPNQKGEYIRLTEARIKEIAAI